MRIKLFRSPNEPSCPPNKRFENAGQGVLEIFLKLPLGFEFEVLGVIYVDWQDRERIEYAVRAPDSNAHLWVSHWFFEVIDQSIPSNWIINSWPESTSSFPVPLVIGPSYFAGGPEQFVNFENRQLEEKNSYYEHLKSLNLFITPTSEDENLQILKRRWTNHLPTDPSLQ